MYCASLGHEYITAYVKKLFMFCFVPRELFLLTINYNLMYKLYVIRGSSRASSRSISRTPMENPASEVSHLPRMNRGDILTAALLHGDFPFFGEYRLKN